MAFKVGDKVKWSSHGGHAEGKVVKVAHEDGTVSGHHYTASREAPKYIVETDEGKQAAHTEDALSRG